MYPENKPKHYGKP